MSLKLSKEGYTELLAEIERKEEELKELRIYKGKEAVHHGDAWHDNYSFEQAEIQERRLIQTIATLRASLKDVEIVSEGTEKQSIVQIGSTVRVRMTFSGDEDSEELSVTISGNYNAGLDSSKVSVNSPLATCILGKKVGFSGSYTVNSTKIMVDVLEIL